MATYLLRADNADMARWKADAVRREVPFSRWLRDAAEMWLTLPYVSVPIKLVEAVSAAECPGPDGTEAASTGGITVDPGADRPPVPVQARPPVDLRQQAIRLAERMNR